MAWHQLSNNELRSAIMNIVKTSNSEEQVNRRAKVELNYPFRIAVSYSKPNSRGQRMSMFMAHAADGQTLT